MIVIIKLFLTCLVGVIGINTLTYNDNTNNIDVSVNVLNNYNVLEKEETIEQEEIKKTEETIVEKQEVIEKNESIKEDIIEQEIKKPIKEETLESTKEEIIEKPKEEKIEEVDVIETIIGKMSGYGPDCYGCTSNKTASGYYVGDGNIYYDDETYGEVRIVSADKKYPFGSIVRISNVTFQTEPIIAIVLDRGGAIGLDKNIQFDLLFVKEKDASVIGIERNVNFEILRLGY